MTVLFQTVITPLDSNNNSINHSLLVNGLFVLGQLADSLELLSARFALVRQHSMPLSKMILRWVSFILSALVKQAEDMRKRQVQNTGNGLFISHTPLWPMRESVKRRGYSPVIRSLVKTLSSESIPWDGTAAWRPCRTDRTGTGSLLEIIIMIRGIFVIFNISLSLSDSALLFHPSSFFSFYLMAHSVDHDESSWEPQWAMHGQRLR